MHRPVIHDHYTRVRLISSIRPGNSAAARPPGHEGYFQLRISSTRRSTIPGIIAHFILAFICLSGGTYHTHRLLLPPNEGKRADAAVLESMSGAAAARETLCNALPTQDAPSYHVICLRCWRFDSTRDSTSSCRTIDLGTRSGFTLESTHGILR